MIKLFNIDLGIIQAVWKKEGGQNKYQASMISKYRLLLIFPEEYNSTSLHKLPKNMCFLCVYCLAKESCAVLPEHQAVLPDWEQMWSYLCCLEYFLHNTETQQNRGIFCNYSSVHRSALFTDLQSADSRQPCDTTCSRQENNSIEQMKVDGMIQQVILTKFSPDMP